MTTSTNIIRWRDNQDINTFKNNLEKRPKLRFPGFDELWRAEKLSDFAERVIRKNTKNETDIPLTISSKDGLVD